jgi:hypothetical protein
MITNHTAEPQENRLRRSSPSCVNRAEILQVLATLPDTAHLTSQEAAAYINTTAAVLRVWRSIGKGPRFRGRGHFVRYSKGDLDAFMAGFDHRFEGGAA